MTVISWEKIKFLPDPVLFEEEIKRLSRKNNFKPINYSFFLSIGRLTKQKNHELLINLYKKYEIKDTKDEETFSNVALTVAEFTSIKPAQMLEMQEMECLLAQWGNLGSPITSIQDTPFLIEISLQELKEKIRI